MTPPLVCGNSCVLFVCTLSMTGKSMLYKRRGHFILSIEKNAISERKDNVRTGLRGNSGQNPAGLSFRRFLLLYQGAEQLGNAAQIDICHLVSSLSWICI